MSLSDTPTKRGAGVIEALATPEATRREETGHYQATETQRQMIQDLSGQGLSPTTIARRLKVTRQTVYAWKDRRAVHNIASPGAPRTVVTTEAVDAVKNIVRANKHTPMSHEQLAAKLKKKGHIMPSSSLHRAKNEAGIRAVVGKSKPERGFWEVNRLKRVAAARERKKWTAKMLRGATWLDESECDRKGAWALHAARQLVQQAPGSGPETQGAAIRLLDFEWTLTRFRKLLWFY